MAEAADGLSAVVETATQMVTEKAIHVAFSRDAGGTFSFFLSCEKSVVKTLCITGVTMYGMYTTSQLLARAIDGIVNKGLGGHRTDQGIVEIRTGSLHVELRCFTDERFLEVWRNYESGRIKECLQDEFTQCGVQLEGLMVRIENLEEVNQTKIEIERRHSLGSREALDRKEAGINKKLDEIKETVDEIKANQLKVDDIVKVNCENVKREIIHELAVTSRREDEKPQTSNSFEEVIVIGGNGTEDTPLTSVKKAVVGKDHIVWVSLPPMNVPRSHVSSAVIGRQIFVIGGGTDSIETLKVDQLPLQWAMSKAVLPFCLFGHSSVVYQGRLIVIGGYNSSNGTYSDEIHEILLTPPYSSKLLGKLPKSIGYHGAELVNNKIFIFGGKKDEELYDDILAYDLVRNECRMISKLPYPLRYMSTVQLKNKVILIGGEERMDIPSKEVIMYDTKSANCSDFPPMNHSRRGCSAVISGDVILVVGGYGREGKILKSVECYDVNQKIWKDLPRMKEARGHSTAVICPQF